MTWGNPSVQRSENDVRDDERRAIVDLLWRWSQEGKTTIRDAGVLQRAARMLADFYKSEWNGDRYEQKRARRDEIEAFYTKQKAERGP